MRRAKDVKSGKVGVEYTSWPHYMLQTRGVATSAFGSQTDVVEAIAKGEIPAGMVTEPSVGWYLKARPGGGGEGLPTAMCAEPELSGTWRSGWSGSVGRLRNAVNQALDRLLANRTITAIFAKYMPASAVQALRHPVSAGRARVCRG